MEKKLYKSRTDKKISGVCGGIAAYFGMDATLVRIIYAVAALFTTGIPFVLIYIVLALIMPEEPENIQ